MYIFWIKKKFNKFVVSFETSLLQICIFCTLRAVIFWLLFSLFHWELKKFLSRRVHFLWTQTLCSYQSKFKISQNYFEVFFKPAYFYWCTSLSWLVFIWLVIIRVLMDSKKNNEWQYFFVSQAKRKKFSNCSD